ncbi:MAG TPA: hypothetical protein VML54_00285 [Candidatus Limnocylindrales bacterium]|nr:hypothetical protein [Candidatus Limnocylindrales bacterium]
MRHRALASLVSVLVLAGAVPALAAPLDEVLMPLGQYNTAKGRTLATTYRPQLVQLYDHIYHCIPWVDLQTSGIGFRTPKGATEDERHLAVWVLIDQSDPDGSFGKLPQERRASAMMSRYGVELLRRMTALGPLARDGNLAGFAVILSWIKPGSGRFGAPLVNETLALFADRARTVDFLTKKLPASEFIGRARVAVFDGKDELGRLPLEIWDDSFVTTYKLPNYAPPKNQRC